MNTDTQLRRDILDELEWEPSVLAAEIGVAVREGVVTLTGSVPSFAEKVTAEQATKRVSGVRAVANDLEVRLTGADVRTDTDIALAVSNALEWRTSFPYEEVKASVSKGWVTLEGEVDWQHQKVSAEDAVRYLLGVRGVINQIAVRPRISSAEVRSRIESAFRRSAELDARNIEVEAREDQVILRGKVHSWSEWQEAERTTWAAPGVSKVKNLITVSP